MKPLQRKILEQLVDGLAEPVMVARLDTANWPIVMTNPAFDHMMSGDPARGQPFVEFVEQLAGRDLAMEISDALRKEEESRFPIEIAKREYLLVLKPLSLENNPATKFCAAYWRSSVGSADAAGQGDVHQALLKAKRRIRDLSRDDPVTGLLNESAFRELFAHDWAVAAREKMNLAVVAFWLDDFDSYRRLFGGHAADSCLRRVAQAIRRCLRRASDVASRCSTDEGDFLVVLSHASEQKGVEEFATRIAAAVRELGLHHPHSESSRFVTVSFRVGVADTATGEPGASEFLDSVLRG